MTKGRCFKRHMFRFPRKHGEEHSVRPTKVNVTFLSDLHGYTPELPGGDLLIFAGDLTAKDTAKQNKEALDWLTSQKYDVVILIGGNHDCYLEANPFKKYGNVHYLLDELCIYNGVYIYGSPWTLSFQGLNPHCMAFTCENEHKLREKFDNIPKDLDILVTHSPPKGILDINLGSVALYDRTLLAKPRYHVFGHIHEMGGEQMKGPSDITYINAAFCDKHYEPTNKIITKTICLRQSR